MMRFFFFFLMVPFSAYALLGHDVGGGGDSVLCQDSAGTAFRGYYALDYMLTYDGADEPAPVSSWEQSAERIEKILRAKSEAYADSFADFVKLMPNENDYTQARVWERASFGLVDIHDQMVIRKLPANCYKPAGGDGINVIQSVIRKVQGDTIIYDFDPQILGELRAHRPLQFSFLMVHEWLRDFTDDVAAIRRVNRLLHSRRGEALSPGAFYLSLANMGLRRETDFVPVCNRTAGIRGAIETQQQMGCSAITRITSEYPLQPVLSAQNLGIRALKAGDFSGLAAIIQIYLTGNLLQTLPENVFYGALPGTRLLMLDGNQIEKLYERTFEGLGLELLSLKGNRLKMLPSKIFSRTLKLVTLDLSNNQLSELPSGLFDGVSGLNEVNLSANGIRDIPVGYFKKLPFPASVLLKDNPLPPAVVERMQKEYEATGPRLLF